jgi:glycosyltransferase involved in cell wall biosynthesis
MFVTIIIPTYNRAKLLDITLNSLLEQNYPKDLYEIMVVDNNSTDNTAQVIKNWSEKTNGLIQYYFEGRQGSHFARNGVVKYAKGDILYFTDDDMIADKAMLRELVSVFQKYPEVGSATGRVLPRWETEPPHWVKKYCTNGWLSLHDRTGDEFVSDDDFGVFSCHQAVRKALFIKAGGYNPDIVNGEWLGDNETGLNIKLREQGAKFGFTKDAVTLHMIPSARMTQQYLDKRFANQGNCDCYTDYRAFRFSKSELSEQNAQFRKQKYLKTAKYIATKLLRNDKWHIHKAYIHYYSARIKYNNRLISDKKWVEMVLINDWINI